MKIKNSHQAFSLIELSIVILIIGLLVAGIVKGKQLYNKTKLTSAKSITASAPVNRIKDLLVWYETTLESSIDPNDFADDGLITNWNDNKLLGSKYNLSQSTNSRKPSYIESGINGLPSLEFAGTFDANTNNDCMATSGNNILFNESYTQFVVARKNNLNSSTISKIALTSGGATQATAYTSAGDNFAITFRKDSAPSGGETLYSSSTSQKTLEPLILTIVRNQQAQTINSWFNSSQIFTDEPLLELSNLTVNGLQLSVGALGCPSSPPRTFDGMISEFIIFNRALKSSEINAIQSYLSQKYNIRIDG